MLETMKALAERSVMERVVLLVNHVVAAEPAATGRLRPHAGRTLRFELRGWPSLLPALAPLSFRITPAGLFEWLEDAGPAPPDLNVGIDASNPALALARLVVGERPAMTVDGDPGLAADVNWLSENLRWEVQDDLARIVGDAPAREIARIGGGFARAMRDAVRRFGDLARRAERPAAEPPPR